MLEVVPLLGVALFSDRRQAGRFYREQMAPVTDRFAAGLAASLEGWRHREVDATLLAQMMLGTYWWLAMEANFRRTKIDQHETAVRLTDMFVQVMGDSLRARHAEEAPEGRRATQEMPDSPPMT